MFNNHEESNAGVEILTILVILGIWKVIELIIYVIKLRI